MIITLPGYKEKKSKHFVNIDRLNDDSIIVDVGACIGDVTKRLRVHKQTAKCKIFAIECDRRNLEVIKKQNFYNVEICEKALVGQNIDGPVKFYRCPRGPNWGSIEPANITDRWKNAEDSYYVKTLKINDVFDEFGIDKIDYMKMDIEGSEKMIFDTMSMETAKKIKQISVEIHWPNKGVGITMQWAEKRFEELGFKVERKERTEMFCEQVCNRKLFIDVGPGRPNTEAWGREKDFTIVGLEPCTIRYNNLKDIYPSKLLNVAVSDKNGEISCWEDSKHGGVACFIEDDNTNKNFRKVRKKAIKLDSLDWKGFDEIHIWADIEGAELLMLKGATEILSSGQVRWINLEIRKNAPTEGWATAEQIYGFLDKYGFKPNFPLDQLQERKHRDVIFMPKEV